MLDLNHPSSQTRRPHSRTRRPKLWAALLVVFALAVGACSSGDASSPAAPASDPTTTPTDGSPTGGDTADTTRPTPTVEPPAATEPDVDGLDAYFDELEASGFDGVVAVREGTDITTRAFGGADRENDVPVDAETVFDIGSLTKQFTAAAILRLEMEGLVSVDDTLGDHVAGLPDDQAAITLHQLLTHTSGLPVGLGADDEPIGRSDYLALVGDTPLIHEPGGTYEYSNVGYALLGAVIEVVTGAPYETYLHAALFEPAGMADTGYVLPDWDGHTIAVGYDGRSGDRFGRPNEQVWDVDGPYWHLRASGGLLSTAADMLRWDVALTDDRVLDATARAKFFAPHVPDAPVEGIGYGYGWNIVPMPMGTPLITHSGSNGIFWADLLRFVDQDIAVFMVTNTYEDADGDVASDVANHVFDGALSSMSDGDDADDTSDANASSGVDAALQACGFVSVDALPDSAEIATLPDSPAGRTVAVFVDLLANGDAAARLDFAANHVSAEFGGGDLAVVADSIGELQQLLADHEVTVTLMQDDVRFHLVMAGPRTELISVAVDPADPERLACVAVLP